MRTIFSFEDRIYTDFVAVDIAEDLFLFISKLAEVLSVLSEEPMIVSFGFQLVVLDLAIARVASDYSLIGYKSTFEEFFHIIVSFELVESVHRGFSVYSTIVCA